MGFFVLNFTLAMLNFNILGILSGYQYSVGLVQLVCYGLGGLLAIEVFFRIFIRILGWLLKLLRWIGEGFGKGRSSSP